MNTIKSFNSKTIVFCLAALFASSAFAVEMPRLQFAIGEVIAIGLDGKERILKKGDALQPGEKMLTKKGAMAQLRLFKQGVVVLRDDSELLLMPPVKGEFGVSLDKGLMRTVTKLAYRQGKIDVLTPGADIAVQAGDVLTGVGIGGKEKDTLSQVLDGKVKVTTGKQETVAAIGKVLQITPGGGSVKVIDKLPDVMQLRLPQPSGKVSPALKGNTAKKIGGTFNSDATKIAVLNPKAGSVADRPGS